MKVYKFLGIPIWSVSNKPDILKKYPKVKSPVALPAKGGRVSIPDSDNDISSNLTIGGLLKIISPDFELNSIPIIRCLVKEHPILSQALTTMVELANTGYNIKFDASVSSEEAVIMQRYIEKSSRQWADTDANIHGLINKKIAQVIVSGALSSEWIPKYDLTGISTNALVNPEKIRFVYNKQTGKHDIYQKISDLSHPRATMDGYLKLNPNTFKYYALNGDTSSPYGYPPFLAALDSVKIEKSMVENIQFIVEQLGVMGFLHVLYQKPNLVMGNTTSEKEELESFLEEAVIRLQTSLKNGVVAGYADDVEFDFKQVTKDFSGVKELWDLNESNLTSGVKMDPSLLGKNHGSTETQITVVFTKMLAQLKNVQNLVKADLEFGFTLELVLAGFKFNSIEVIFNPSTGVDKLKDEQSEEIRIRNSNALYWDGIISLAEYARRHGYDDSDESEPRVMRVNVATVQEDVDPQASKERKRDQKNKVKRKKTDKKNYTPKTLK